LWCSFFLVLHRGEMRELLSLLLFKQLFNIDIFLLFCRLGFFKLLNNSSNNLFSLLLLFLITYLICFCLCLYIWLYLLVILFFLRLLFLLSNLTTLARKSKITVLTFKRLLNLISERCLSFSLRNHILHISSISYKLIATTFLAVWILRIGVNYALMNRINNVTHIFLRVLQQMLHHAIHLSIVDKQAVRHAEVRLQDSGECDPHIGHLVIS